MKSKDQTALRMYVRAREDFQAMRKRMDNRIGVKAQKVKGKKVTQNISSDRTFSGEDIQNFTLVSDQADAQETAIEKMLKKVLKRFPVWNQWLKDVKGVGEVAGGWLLGEFDIEKATAVSKMWQYAGMNPGLVKGKKRIAKKSYKPEMGTIISEMKNIKSGEMDCLIETDILIRGDKATEGFVLPYNANLRKQLIGVLAGGFIKCKSSYAIEFYYPYKARLEKESNIVVNTGKARKDDGKAWKDVSLGHRDNAAKRYMIKMFLKDLYVAWRTIENLPVRVPYEEEYLGKKHIA